MPSTERNETSGWSNDNRRCTNDLRSGNHLRIVNHLRPNVSYRRIVATIDHSMVMIPTNKLHRRPRLGSTGSSNGQAANRGSNA